MVDTDRPPTNRTVVSVIRTENLVVNDTRCPVMPTEATLRGRVISADTAGLQMIGTM